jgi:ethanolamine utilization protein EutQ (cupin superfamily)
MAVTKYPAATGTELPDLNIPEIAAFMKDVATASSGGAPITFGLFRMSAGKPLAYTYEFDEFKLLLEGEMTIVDAAGKATHLQAGDVIQFSKGDAVEFSSASTGLAFYVAQR